MRRALFATSPRVGQSWKNIANQDPTGVSGLTPDSSPTMFGGHSLKGYTETTGTLHSIPVWAGVSDFYAGQMYAQIVVNNTGVRDWACLMLNVYIGATPYYAYQWVDIENRVLGVTTGSTLTILDSGIVDLGDDLSRIWLIAEVNNTVAAQRIYLYLSEGDGDNSYTGDPELGVAVYAGEWMMLCEGDETVPYQVPG